MGSERIAVQVQPPGQVPQARRPGEAPGERCDDRDDPVGNEDGGAHRGPADEGPVHDEGDDHSEDQFDGDADDGDDEGVGHRLPPQARAEHRGVVGQADEDGLGREPQVGPPERQPEGVEDGVRGDRQHHDDGRGAEQVGEPALVPGPARRLRRPAGRSGGIEDVGPGGHYGTSPREAIASRSVVVRRAGTLVGSMWLGGDSALWISSETLV